jgi:glycosyltransferase involved in cell wall biosynthesis
MNAPLVSVVVPSYNHGRFIGDALSSVLRQTYENVECIVIDDGSVDNSYEYIQDTFGADRRVTAMRRENRGADATINEAIAFAKGRYISILNSDDYYDSSRIELLVDAARESSQPFFGITGVRFVDEHGAKLRDDDPHRRYYDGVCAAASDKPDACGLWVGNIAITTSNFFFSSDVYHDVGPFKPLRYAHDWDWALRASARFNLMRIDRELVSYRKHGANTIDEVAPLNHMVEDAYVWATALRNGAFNPAANDNGARPYFASMLENVGFPLLPVLYLLASSRTDAELLAAIARGQVQQELEAICQQGAVGGQFADSLRTLVRDVAHLREEKAALESEVDRLKASVAPPPPPRAKSGGLFARLRLRKASAEAIAPAPREEAPGSLWIDLGELGDLRGAGPKTLLYAEGPGLTRVHLYRTSTRFVLAVYDFNPAQRRSLLKAAATGRVMPLQFLMRSMTIRPERCDRDFLTRLSARGLNPACAPVDQSLAGRLPANGLYGETLETLVYDESGEQLIGRALGDLPPANIVGALAKFDITVETSSGAAAMTYAGYDEGGDLRIGGPKGLELRASAAPLWIKAVAPA